MRYASPIAVLLSAACTLACGGPISSSAVRERIATIGGASLSPDSVRVERIATQTQDRAIVEFTVQGSGEYARNAEGDWELVSVRIADNDWISLADLDAALAAMDVARTTSSLRMLATGVAAYQRQNGSLPDPSGPDSLPDLLHPLFVPELTRQDAWGSEFLYELFDDTFRLRSAGPDLEPGTPDDIEVPGVPGP